MNLDDWMEVDRLGRGATVQLMQHRESGEKAVLKSLSLSMLDDWKSVELFEREASVLRGIEHERIPKLIDVAVDKDMQRFYMLQSYFDAPSIADRRHEDWQEDRILNFAVAALEVLSFLHSHSPPIIHRDIEPANILFDHVGRAYLVDFGGVQRLIAREIGGSTIVGTSGFMAPEQLIGKAVPSSDLFGLGMVLVFLATGADVAKLPSDGLRPNWRGLMRTKLSKEVCEFIDRLGSANPSDRPLNGAAALEEALEIQKRRSAPIVQPRNTSVRLAHEPNQLVIRAPSRKFDSHYLIASLSFAFIAIIPIVKQLPFMWLLSALALLLVLTPTIYELVRSRKQNEIVFGKDKVTLKEPNKKPREIRRHDVLKASPGYGTEKFTLFLTTTEGLIPIAYRLRQDEQVWLAEEIGEFL